MIITSGHDPPIEQDNTQRGEGMASLLNGQAINTCMETITGCFKS